MWSKLYVFSFVDGVVGDNGNIVPEAPRSFSVTSSALSMTTTNEMTIGNGDTSTPPRRDNGVASEASDKVLPDRKWKDSRETEAEETVETAGSTTVEGTVTVSTIPPVLNGRLGRNWPIQTFPSSTAPAAQNTLVEERSMFGDPDIDTTYSVANTSGSLLRSSFI